MLYQKNLRNRVSYSQYFDAEPSPGSDSTQYIGTHNSATYYSYDIHGNVDTLVQDFANPDLFPNMMNTTNNRYKKIVYDYDLISGKVNMVSYQPGFTDEFYHRYTYDAENRITDVETSHDKLWWEHDARYRYYRHGPLARAIIGEEQVQGTDYAYTLQGWLKGVNSSSMFKGNYDMGRDGKPTGTTTPPVITSDAYGFNLNYFTGDYAPIGGTNPFLHTNIFSLINTSSDTIAKSLYNGNIASMFVNMPKAGKPQLYGYAYDQLNRIKSMDAFNGFIDSTNAWSSTPVAKSFYKEKVQYDPNGNILSYIRHGDSARVEMDSMSYAYTSGTNKLDYVDDGATDAASGDYPKYNDIKQGQTSGNYTYDEIGNLIADVSENIDVIDWSVYGKIRSIHKSSSGGLGLDPDTTITYTYDAAGNRISKTAPIIKLKNPVIQETWYVRDASGNVMSVYTGSQSETRLAQEEIHLYGSTRLGIFNPKREVSSLGVSNHFNQITTFERGDKLFELTNHLGNVLATISDRRLEVDSGGSINHHNADVITANDYYPFGMQMPSRVYQNGSGSYRYSMNGQEKSDELNPNMTTALYWEYDSRLGRRWNVDPQFNTSISPYAVFGNNPISNIDPDGDDTINIIRTTTIQQFSRSSTGSNGGNTGVAKNATPRDLVTTKGSIEIKDAPGVDVFQMLTINTIIDPNGNSSTSTSSAVLNIRGTENMAYRNAGQNVKGFYNDRFALAASLPSDILDYYASKNKSYDWPTYVGALEAKALQSDVPFAQKLGKIQNITYTVTGVYAIYRIALSRMAINVTEGTIANALRGSTMQTVQKSVSLPAIKKYVEMLEAGSASPAIKVADNIIVDGNHRYIAHKIMQMEAPTVPGTLSPSLKPLAKPIQDIIIDPEVWPNH